MKLCLAVLLAALGGAMLATRAAEPDDETPPPAFDKEAGYRRRYTPEQLKPVRATRHYGGAPPAATYVREGRIDQVVGAVIEVLLVPVPVLDIVQIPWPAGVVGGVENQLVAGLVGDGHHIADYCKRNVQP